MDASLPARLGVGEKPAQTLTDEYREHPCDLCGQRDPVEVPHCREYTGGQPIHICRRCGFVYVIRRRSAGRIAAVWSEEIFGASYTAAIPAVISRLTYVVEFLRLHLAVQGKRICEVGAGEGEFLEIIRGPRYGVEPFAIEPSPANGRRLQERGIPHFVGTVEEFAARAQTAESRFDLVAILWTLENCQDCRRMLTLARGMLAPGGAVVVATGSRLLVPFKKPLHAYLSTNPADTHAFRFSANTLRAILTVSGFDVTHTNRYLDHDVLCAIATKRQDEAASPPWTGDNYLDVYNFFERWWADTRLYFPDPV